jgi:hypothetical protein
MKIRNDDRTANWIKQTRIDPSQRWGQAPIVPGPAKLPGQEGVVGNVGPKITGQSGAKLPDIPGTTGAEAGGQVPFALGQSRTQITMPRNDLQRFLKYNTRSEGSNPLLPATVNRFESGQFTISEDRFNELSQGADAGDPWSLQALQLHKDFKTSAQLNNDRVELIKVGDAIAYAEFNAGKNNAPPELYTERAAIQSRMDGSDRELNNSKTETPPETQSQYYNGSYTSASDLKPSDIPTTVGEVGIIGGKALALIMANNVNFRIDQDNNIIPYKNVNGEELDLVGAQRTEMLHAKRMMDDAHTLNLETSKSNATTANAMLIQENAQKFENDQADIQRRFDANQADLTRALTSGTLEESIRANRVSEGLARERNMMEKRQFAADMMYQIATNPSALFFLRQSGIVDQLSELMGIDFKVFGGPTDGPTNPIGAFNLQSWSQLTPEQQKVALYSMQAQTGLSTAEIMRQIEQSAPGGTGRVIRGISG